MLVSSNSVPCHRLSLKTSSPVHIILFDPPDPRRLRYLTTGVVTGDSTASSAHLASQDDFGVGGKRNPAAGLDRILPLVRVQVEFRSWLINSSMM